MRLLRISCLNADPFSIRYIINANVEIHSIDHEGKISRYKKMSVSMEKEIEDFIENNPTILEKDIIIIGRQVNTDEGNIVDLMGLDKEGNVVIIELKKDEAPRKVISQLLDYGVWAQALSIRYDVGH